MSDFLARLKAAHEAATPGPWTGRHRHVDGTLDDDEQSGLGLEFVKGPPEPMLRGQFAKGADLRLILLLRNHAPELLAVLERLDACRDTPCPLCLYDVGHWDECPFAALDALDALNAEAKG